MATGADDAESTAAVLKKAQIEAIFDIEPEQIQKLNVETKMGFIFQHKDFEARKKEAFWNAISAFAAAAIPIFAFLGITRLFEGRK